MEFAIEEAAVDYEQLMRRLAIESITSPDVFALFKKIIPHSVEVLSSYLPSFSNLNQGPAAKFSSPAHLALMKKVSSVNFLAYEDTLVFVPEGFNGKLIPFLELLIAQSKVVLEHGKQVVVDYNLDLSIFLSNADIRQTLKSLSQQYRQIRTEREGYQKAVESFFDKKNSTVSRRPLKQVIDRFSDLNKVYELEERLVGIQKQQNLQVIVSEVQKACDMLKLINARISEGEISSVSGQAAKNLAEGAYEVGKYVEYMALYAYFVESVLASIKNTSEQFEKIFA